MSGRGLVKGSNEIVLKFGAGAANTWVPRTIKPVELIEFGRLSEEQYAELVGDEADPWGAGGDDLAWRPKDRHVGLRGDDGRLVAAAGLVVVEVRFGEQPPIPVVGLGGVIVTAAYRGRGLGRRVITEALERAEEMGPEIAMLFCRAENVGLYRRHDFAEMPEPVFVDQPYGPVEISEAMWRPLREGAPLPEGIAKVNGLPF
jgi:predicted GNAT family N-acyltransferase